MVGMQSRYLAAPLAALCFKRHKIAMVSGPRQCGKTTLAKMLLAGRASGRYHNWDQREFRRAWARTPSAILPEHVRGHPVPLVVLDEIHKDRLWKRTLKGLYDTLTVPCDFLVTGSSRLNVYRRGSDSLLGRYFHFRLHPFSLREMERADILAPDAMLDALFARGQPASKQSAGHLASLMAYGPFPEPLFEQDARSANAWRRTREQAVIREDLRDISRLPDLGRLEMMASLLPERVGSPFSVANLREDLEVTFDTVRRWTSYLKEIYYLFELKPWTRRIARSLRREGKIYLWDFGAIRNEAARFENLVACHLLKTCHAWEDTGEGRFELFYLRTKDREEIDFLIVRDGVPWLPVEVKTGNQEPSSSWRRFSALLPCRRGLQIVNQPAWAVHAFGDARVLVAGAAEVLRYFA